MKPKASEQISKSPPRLVEKSISLNKGTVSHPAKASSSTAKSALNIGPGLFERDSYVSTALPEILDRSVHALAARFTLGLSPSALASAYSDWALHFATAPGKQFQLNEKAA